MNQRKKYAIVGTGSRAGMFVEALTKVRIQVLPSKPTDAQEYIRTHTGQFDVYVKIGDPNEYISIPESAIINDDGLHTAYVQSEGESFEKRILKTGIIDGGYVQVIEGLKVGERVVTIGAYQVRLAALSPESAIGQGHVH